MILKKKKIPKIYKVLTLTYYCPAIDRQVADTSAALLFNAHIPCTVVSQEKINC